MKATKTMQTQKFINSYNLLKIDQLDKKIDEFIMYNYAFYTDPKKTNYDLRINDDGFAVVSTIDECSFKMSFSPSVVNPDVISIELSNLGANLEQRIIIKFDEVGVNISFRKYFSTMDNDSKGTTKEKVDTIYIDGKKRYRKAQSHHVGKNIFEDSSYSMEEITYMSAVDSSYVMSTKVVAEERAYFNTRESYEKFDGENYLNITALEFIDSVEKFEQEKKDIKQKNKKI